MAARAELSDWLVQQAAMAVLIPYNAAKLFTMATPSIIETRAALGPVPESLACKYYTTIDYKQLHSQPLTTFIVRRPTEQKIKYTETK